MQTMTHLVYEDVFRSIDKRGLTLPSSCLDNERIIDELVDEFVGVLDTVEVVSYSSFLNMIVQTYEPDESASLGREELAAVGISRTTPGNKVFFHRDSLLHMITRAIARSEAGNVRTIPITGGHDRRGAMRYYKALLLISSKLNRASRGGRQVLLKYFIRDYPFSYLPETTHTIYTERLQRYWHIYGYLLKEMGAGKMVTISKALKELERDSGLSLREHFSILTGLMNWFLTVPVLNRETDQDTIQGGFDCRNIRSFYIRNENFGDESSLIQLIGKMAADLPEMKERLTRDRRDPVQGFYSSFQTIFDRPIFKVEEGGFCIIDLDFLLKGICSGLLWRIKDAGGSGLQALKGEYGDLLEKYFDFLVQQIFSGSELSKTPRTGADYVVESETHVIVLEFTTEYYRFSSLYGQSDASFLQDIHRLLFNKGKDDPYSRGKSDEGKLLKLNKYVIETAAKGKPVIPVLVTKNYIGDYDLLNQFDAILDSKIGELGLTCLKTFKPLILCLDDLETCWAVSPEDEGARAFIAVVQAWQTADKGRHLFNFSYFISNREDVYVVNQKYADLFNYRRFLDDLKGKRGQAAFLRKSERCQG